MHPRPRADGSGRIRLCDRTTEEFIARCDNNAAREIDGPLLVHPDVVGIAAFAYPCAIYCQQVGATVRLNDGSTITCQFCNGGSTPSRPNWVHILRELSKVRSGKIQGLNLQDLIIQPRP